MTVTNISFRRRECVLVLLMSIAVSAGPIGADDNASAPSAISESLDSKHDADNAIDTDGKAQDVDGDVDLDGTLEVLHEDRADGSSSYQHFVSTRDGRRLRIDGVRGGDDLLTGDRVHVKGFRSGKTIRLLESTDKSHGDGSSLSLPSSGAGLQVVAPAPLSNTFGPQKIVLLLVNFSNDTSQPTTAAIMRALLAESDAFYRENSYQQTSLLADVFGWYTLPITGGFSKPTCPTWDIKAHADQAAGAAGIDLSQYTKRLYLFPLINSCGFTGMSTVGGNPSSTWFNGAPLIGILNHELGHAFGLYHSNGLACHPSIVTGSCSVREYGDAFDTMGNARGHFNAFQKSRLGWIGYDDSPSIATVTSSGTFTLPAYENASSEPIALRVPRGTSGQSFYVEFRRNIGQDANLVRTGVFIHLASDSDPNSSWLLDMTPSTIAYAIDAFLDVGKSFTDPVSEVTITTLAVSSTSATVAVDIGSPCTRARPVVSAAPAQGPAVPAGTSVSYTVTVTNADSSTCAPSSFSLQAVVPSGWTQSYSAPSVTISPGATGSATLSVTSPSVPEGPYTVVSTATHGQNPTLSGSDSVIYTVAASTEGGIVGGGIGTFVDAFNRADSPTGLGNGWMPVAGIFGVSSGHASSAASRALHAVVQSTLFGATQTASVRFTSTNNNNAPRFGLFARYVDDRNYYACYRQVGGSSVLRIAKVANGVETILKYAAVANPKKGVPFAVGCQVTGTTITASLGSTAISATDGTLSAGKTGFFAGYTPASGKAAKHEVDDFQATIQ
jgi:hypothetical protein